MITLSKRLKSESQSSKNESNTNTNSARASNSNPPPKVTTASGGRISIRDQLLVKEIQEMEQTLPVGCKIKFEDPNVLHEFVFSVVPEDGYWVGGRFKFRVVIGEDYNMIPPSVKCLTKLWHPNISENGDVCLSILRLNAIDGMGWSPIRRLKDVTWGLSSLLIGDLLNFDDPLNSEAAEHYQRDKDGFRIKARDWTHKYARKK